MQAWCSSLREHQQHAAYTYSKQSESARLGSCAFSMLKIHIDRYPGGVYHDAEIPVRGIYRVNNIYEEFEKEGRCGMAENKIESKIENKTESKIENEIESEIEKKKAAEAEAEAQPGGVEQSAAADGQQECCCCARHKIRDEKEYRDLMNRLRRIEGQVRGLQNMLEKDAYCPDILIQASAVNAALNSFSRVLLSNHIRSCVADNIREGNDDVIEELVATLQKLMR